MKKYSLKILFSIFIFYLISCSENTDKKERYFLLNAIEQLKVDKQYNWVVILPGLGCHGCIQEGEFFMKNNIANKKILFVLTNISSLKIFQQKTDIRVRDFSNIYIDRDNQFKLPTKNAIYPCIIQVNDGEFLQYTFQSPTSAAFSNLKYNINK